MKTKRLRFDNCFYLSTLTNIVLYPLDYMPHYNYVVFLSFFFDQKQNSFNMISWCFLFCFYFLKFDYINHFMYFLGSYATWFTNTVLEISFFWCVFPSTSSLHLLLSWPTYFTAPSFPSSFKPVFFSL